MIDFHRGLAAAAAMLVTPVALASGLDAEALDRSIRGLNSIAQETQLLFALARKGEIPARYLRVQREELGNVVHETAKPLDDAPPERLAQRAARAKALSQQLSSALEKEDSAAADAAARELHQLTTGKP